MATLSGSMTVEELRQLPEDGSFYYELRHGEAVKVSKPKPIHVFIQQLLVDMLKAIVAGNGYVTMNWPFRALPEYEYREADVIYFSKERWDKIQTELYSDFVGVPDLVIEVLSPSNTATEMSEKEKLCIDNGAKEFWLVNPFLKHVKVSTPDGITRTYGIGHEIPVNVIGNATIKVDAIFIH